MLLLTLLAVGVCCVRSRNCALPSSFYPVTGNSTAVLARSGESSSAFIPAFPFRYYGRTKAQLVVHVNGAITFAPVIRFGGQQTSVIPLYGLPDGRQPAMIAAFLSHVEAPWGTSLLDDILEAAMEDDDYDYSGDYYIFGDYATNFGDVLDNNTCTAITGELTQLQTQHCLIVCKSKPEALSTQTRSS